MTGQLFTVGRGRSEERLFYYAAERRLLIEVMKKTHGEPMKYLVQLVDASGKPVLLPPGCHFQLLTSGKGVNLLEVHAPHLDAENQETRLDA